MKLTLTLLLATLASANTNRTVNNVASCRTERQDPNERLIALSESQSCWLTDAEIRNLHQHNTGFVDATNGEWNELGRLGLERTSLRLDAKGMYYTKSLWPLQSIHTTIVYPDGPAFPSVVEAATAKVQPKDLKDLLTTFVTKFTTRHKTSAEGLASAQWLYDQAATLSSSHGRSDIKTSVKKFDHGWGQFSIILRLDPVATPKNQDLLILGAHQDSINQRGGTAAPGADDDASGVVTNLVGLQYLLATPEWVPTRPIEYHFYSAEETGLQGSTQIALQYAKEKVDVYAMLQYDMTGWNRGGTKVISFTDDYTTLPLTLLLESYVGAYLTTKASRNTCGYGCSDHAPWFKAGYPTVYPFEEDGDINPNIHSAKDTIETLDFDHMAEFTRLSVAFVVELSQSTDVPPTTDAPSDDEPTDEPTNDEPTDDEPTSDDDPTTEVP
ncbi:Aste57867_25440 [Aphanomyces stellatus]|uniref:Aste57867_25440 protein n=1 Tax=Aphanomyces stellatus TaxID=120398 RepID=A0A485LT62_9STRA|nr:hypothetical protein As57867_025361 [Aphanomyces stellatus]VFU02063.1 Aste57867_25440 [Aphanomyces stellatus]